MPRSIDVSPPPKATPPAAPAPPAVGAAGPVTSLYIHVPFCSHKCEYCAFYSAPPAAGQVDRYVQALVRELELIAPRCQPQTVYVGGGTPSMLSLGHWETLLGAMNQLGLLGAAEWTVECNPATVSREKAALLRSGGVNRISMGVQSLDESLLDRMGRVHSRRQVFASYEILRGAGFSNINLDLMFAIPGQTLPLWRSTLAEAIALGPEHLSCYEVIYEEDTPLYAQLQAGEFDVDEALACDMYEALIDDAAAAGFVQYEIANFARTTRAGVGPDPQAIAPQVPDRACRHNVNYWRGGDFFGLGPSASEYVQGTRSRNWSNTTLYCTEAEKGRRAREFSETLSPLGRAGELAAFGLRMTLGWPYTAFQQRTGFDLRETWRAELDELVRCGWGIDDAGAFRLTRTGLRFADAAARRLLRPEPGSPRVPVTPAA